MAHTVSHKQNANAELLAALILCQSAINEAVITSMDVTSPSVQVLAKASERARAAIAKAGAE